jgi:hypothetical protein
MADDVNHHSTADVPAAGPAPVLVDPVPDRRERARRSSYKTRFGVIYAVLALLLAAGLAAFAVLLVREPTEGSNWSTWQPVGNALQRMEQITDRVPQAYVTAGNDRLNIARARPLVAQVGEQAIPVGAILIQGGATPGSEPVVEEAAGAVGIALCGLGPQCSVPGGESSDADFALRRQAIELSLYAFKFVDDITSVVVFMPPTAQGESTGALYLRRDDLREELKLPLGETLPERTSQVVGESSTQELSAVFRLTDGRRYGFSYEAAPDGNPILVLSPPGASQG